MAEDKATSKTNRHNGVDEPAPRSPVVAGKKRPRPSISGSTDSSADPRSRLKKVSRACDFCKARKARCNGFQPCDKCTAKGRTCLYDAEYTRGRPPTPPSASSYETASVGIDLNGQNGSRQNVRTHREPHKATGPPLPNQPRASSPELGMAEIQGQVVDPTSGFSFLHRAWKRLSARGNQVALNDQPGSSYASPTTPTQIAGDTPLPECRESLSVNLPSPAENRRLINRYFEVCVATYKILHRPLVEEWLAALEDNISKGLPAWQGIGQRKVAVVLVVLAMAARHAENSEGISDGQGRTMKLSDELFIWSLYLTDADAEPALEAAQARIIQALYLLTTSRFDKAWLVFGHVLQQISALGLHRKGHSRSHKQATHEEYIREQFGSRIFWSAYILDVHLGAIFGRPRHYHDDDIDQVLPDRLHDETLQILEPTEADRDEECLVDGLIAHAKIAQITGCITKEVYSIKPISVYDRMVAARKLMKQIDNWHQNLPAHLGAVRPSMLILCYRRQATVVKLAHSHAVMHASRPFLLDSSNSNEKHVRDCVAAARAALEIIDHMGNEGSLYHAFWWTHYVAFCALLVAYVWEIQMRRARKDMDKRPRETLIALAERCYRHLGKATDSNSPSRQYAVILEEFRNVVLGQAAQTQNSHTAAAPDVGATDRHPLPQSEMTPAGNGPPNTVAGAQNMGYPEDPESQFNFDAWQMTDWLGLDASVFGFPVEMDGSFSLPPMD